MSQLYLHTLGSNHFHLQIRGITSLFLKHAKDLNADVYFLIEWNTTNHLWFHFEVHLRVTNLLKLHITWPSYGFNQSQQLFSYQGFIAHTQVILTFFALPNIIVSYWNSCRQLNFFHVLHVTKFILRLCFLELNSAKITIFTNIEKFHFCLRDRGERRYDRTPADKFNCDNFWNRTCTNPFKI